MYPLVLCWGYSAAMAPAQPIRRAPHVQDGLLAFLQQSCIVFSLRRLGPETCLQF